VRKLGILGEKSGRVTFFTTKALRGTKETRRELISGGSKVKIRSKYSEVRIQK